MRSVAAYAADGSLRFEMSVSDDSDLSPLQQTFAHVVTGAGSLADTWYDAATQSTKPRSALPAPDKTAIDADGVEVATWSGLPNPTTVHVTGQGVYTVTDGTFEFSAEQPGEYVVALFGPASYRPREDRIRAT